MQIDYRAPIRRLKATPHRELKAMVAFTGLGLQTLRAMKYGTAPNCRVDTLEKMAAYFAHVDQQPVSAGEVANA